MPFVLRLNNLSEEKLEGVITFKPADNMTVKGVTLYVADIFRFICLSTTIHGRNNEACLYIGQ